MSKLVKICQSVDNCHFWSNVNVQIGSFENNIFYKQFKQNSARRNSLSLNKKRNYPTRTMKQYGSQN